MTTARKECAADAYRERFLAEMLTWASADYWEHRANTFDWCRAQATDFHGRATPAELAERDQRCRETAEACRNHAALLRRYGPPDFVVAEVATVLGEVA